MPLVGEVDAVVRLIVIETVVVFLLELLSVAMTVIVFAPGFRATNWLQLAVPDPAAVSPLARTPLTVTDEIPLSPLPESVTVPDNVIELASTDCPLL